MQAKLVIHFLFFLTPALRLSAAITLLHRGGGPDNTDIARPAEFLVDSNGVVRWENFTEDIRIRAKADEMLAAAKKLP